MNSKRGFTLIEILLVLVLLSMAAVAVIATLPSSTDDTLKQLAKSLSLRVQLLNEEALLSGKDYGLRVDEKQSRYVLLELKEDGWQPLAIDKIPSETQLPDGVAIELSLGGGVWQSDDRLFKPGSLFDEDMFADVEQDKEKKQRPPQIFIVSSGEVTPFTISLYPSQENSEQDGWRIRAKENGEIISLAPGEDDAS
ncbi:type II secretion system minor pseudopilin GspH [Vibrio sp. TRT 21S02]|uniref:type II secretion system minor pseudopilin GspH n=1 Tax=unclassified Vibrio TaxID=2614977 RepID=UPI00349F81A1